jgi:two-component SAPR family response regulator
MREFYFALKGIFIFSLTVICYFNSYAQNYGLGFASHEAHQDKRTTLNLSSEKELRFSGNFGISFDISFAPNRGVYFGYIIRIIENNTRNYDLVYNTSKDHFNMIVGDSLSGINFNIPRSKLYNQWNKIRMSFDVDKAELRVFSNNKVYTQSRLPLKKGNSYKIIFGANRSEPFETTDLPPMKIRNVSITENEKQTYFWPLNEVEGTFAVDVIQKRKAVVNNPGWQTALHLNWQKRMGLTVNGIASVTFDPKKEIVYVVAADTVYAYTVNGSKWIKTPSTDRINLNQGNRSCYNTLDGQLYNFFPGREVVSKYDFTAKQWSANFTPGDVTGFWHFNKMLCAADTSLYVFGGYGYLFYKNTVQQYKFNRNKWSNVKYTGDFFTPRYLAALGATAKGDTAYILGGFGNASGDQILNPKNLYDMMRFTVKDKTFKKLFELKINREDFALANSLVLDEKNDTYYGLIFPRNKYNSTLQLIQGSLKKPDFKVLGNIIPYSFHDVHSYADLFYCPGSKKFITVTLLRTDDNKSIVNLFSLSGPPYSGADKNTEGNNGRAIYYLLAVACISICGFLFWLYKRRQQKSERVVINNEAELPINIRTANHDAEINEMQLAEHTETRSAVTQQFKNAILLFGDLQVFDASGTSITKLFTPLIKELFLLILLHSVKFGRGVSSEKLNEMFWYDKSEKSARNNRSVAIVKLKSLLDKLDHCKLSKDSGYWMLEIDYQHFYVDYHSYLNIIRNRKKLDNDEIQHLSSIVQRGSFLSTSEYEWLDPFKSEIAGDIVDTYLHFLQMPEHHKEPEFLIKIASYILNIDPVNEDAMILKCRSFVALGKHSLAKNTFEHFCKAYKNMYSDSFDKDFQSVLEKVTY